jgi:hypothetical protein
VSIFFLVGGESLWNPASTRGMRYLEAAADYGTRVGLDPGLPFESDEVAVDLARFGVFARRALEDYVAAREAGRETLGWVLGPAVVMLDRAGQPLEAATAEQADALTWARAEYGPIPT